MSFIFSVNFSPNEATNIFHPKMRTIWILCKYLCCFTSNKLCPLYPKVSFSKFNQASVFTGIFPSAIFKVLPTFPHFFNFIAKYSILGAQCYSSGKSYSCSLKLSIIGGIHQEIFLHFPHEKSGIPIVLATSLIVHATLDVKTLIFTKFNIKICGHFCWDLKSSYRDTLCPGSRVRVIEINKNVLRVPGRHTWAGLDWTEKDGKRIKTN